MKPAFTGPSKFRCHRESKLSPERSAGKPARRVELECEVSNLVSSVHLLLPTCLLCLDFHHLPPAPLPSGVFLPKPLGRNIVESMKELSCDLEKFVFGKEYFFFSFLNLCSFSG